MMFSSIPDPSLLDATNTIPTPELVTGKNVFSDCQMSPGGKIAHNWELLS